MKALNCTLTPSCAIHRRTGRGTHVWILKDAMAFFDVHARQSSEEVRVTFTLITTAWIPHNALERHIHPN